MSTIPNGDPNIKPNTIVEGWIYDTGYRGTLDILYGCLVVLVAAVWTVVHLNVPSQNDSDWRIFWRRLRWSLVSITAPDFLTLVAAAQWDCAQRSVKEMAKLPGAAEKWTLVHAFYANSGGFVLEAPDYNGPDGRFPISAESVHYLVSRGYMPLPSITKEEIWDKSKADVFAKGLALLQSAWIFMMAIARTAQGLPLTPIELFTLAFVISTVMSYFFWWRKPQNVGTPTKLWCETTMARVRADAGYSDDQPYEDTPMDFVEKPSRYWKRRDMFVDFDLESGRRKMESTVVELPRWDNASNTNDRISFSSQQPPSPAPSKTPSNFQTVVTWTQTPIKRIPDDAIMAVRLPTKMVGFLMIPSMIHCSIHLAGWNHHFPTETEKILWRIAVIILTVMSSVSVGAVRLLGIKGYKGRYNLLWVWVNGNADPRTKGIWDIVLSWSTFMLILARFYLIVEVCISLRKLPAEVFYDVDWVNWIPHI
ncbi:hypothetical protein V8F33_014153 [Rhypophila sp. PSN 637]